MDTFKSIKKKLHLFFAGKKKVDLWKDVDKELAERKKIKLKKNIKIAAISIFLFFALSYFLAVVLYLIKVDKVSNPQSESMVEKMIELENKFQREDARPITGDEALKAKSEMEKKLLDIGAKSVTGDDALRAKIEMEKRLNSM